MAVRLDSRAGSRLGAGMASRRGVTGHQGMVLWVATFDGSFPTVRKFNADGSVAWTYTETVYGVTPRAVAVDDSGNVYIAGPADGSDYAIMSVSSAGAFRWANTLFAGAGGMPVDGVSLAVGGGYVYVGHAPALVNATTTIHSGSGAGPEDQLCVVTRFTASTGVFANHLITNTPTILGAERIALSYDAATLVIASTASSTQKYLISYNIAGGTVDWTAVAPADGTNVLIPRGLDLDSTTGDIYVTASSSGGNGDTLSHRVSKYDSSGSEVDYLLDATLQGEYVGGIAVTADRRVIWAASDATRKLILRVYDTDLTLLYSQPFYPADNSAIDDTNDLQVDARGRVAIENAGTQAMIFSAGIRYKRAYNSSEVMAFSTGPRFEQEP